MEDVAEDRPQELRLRMFAGAQLRKLLGGVAVPEDGQHCRVDLGGGFAIILRGEVEHLDRPTVLAENAAARLLAEGTLADQRRQPRRNRVVAVPGVVGQRVLHGLDDVRQRVEADHIGGAVGGALRTPDDWAGQRVDDVKTKPQALCVMHHRQDREDADAIGDEIRGVASTHDAFAEARDQPRFEIVEQHRVGGLRCDQFDQMHVAGRIEEVDAAEARAQGLGQRFGQALDRQSRGVRGDDRLRRNERRDLPIEIVFPLDLLGNRFDDQIAVAQLFEVLGVVGGVDVGDTILAAQGRRLELAQCVDGAVDDCVGVAFLGWQVEKQHRHFGIGEMRGNLRAHHTRPEYRGLAYDEVAQAVLLSVDPCAPGISGCACRKRHQTNV